MARPKRRGAFIGPSLHDDPKYVALGRRGKLGLLAQALLPLLKAVMDDQGRSPADVDWVWSKAAAGVGGMTVRTLSAVVALYGESLCHDGAWVVAYTVESRPFLQWIDAESDLEGLRYREASKYPAPPGWPADLVRSWQDDPYARGSRAYQDRLNSKRKGSGSVYGTSTEPPTDDTRNRGPSARVVTSRDDAEPSRDVSGREPPNPPSAHALKNRSPRVGELAAEFLGKKTA